MRYCEQGALLYFIDVDSRVVPRSEGMRHLANNRLHFQRKPNFGVRQKMPSIFTRET